ncbi:MAG TPA: hypothetical protein VM735_10705, partial [Candidatus Kapabacteria bacterium]|nr:hypothetical protein [Candidatus Kapabacteria bacterium]
MAGNGNWQLLSRVPMTNLVFSLSNLNSNERTHFFRALEFITDPPLLELAASGPGASNLRFFGRAGNTYTIQYTTNLSGVVQWNPLLSYTLTNSFGDVSGLQTTNKNRFYQIAR